MSAAPRTVAEPAARRVFVDHVMGMPISVHVRGARARGVEVEQAVGTLFDGLRDAEEVFSTYRPDSEISRLQRGELALANCRPEVREVHRLCEAALVLTGGSFDAWSAVPGRPGVFDPTGLVKTWAVARASRALLDLTGLGVAVGAAGDILVRSGDDGPAWQIGIEDPRDRSRIVATVPVNDGGTATSGRAARGDHIIDPLSGRHAREVLSATVVGPSLMWADVFATAAVARGAAAVRWVQGLHGTSGVLVLADGTVHRWANQP